MKAQKTTKEVIFFGLVGGLSFFIDFAVFNLVLFLHFAPLLASFIATALASVFNFFGNLKLTFGHKEVSSRARTVLVFVITSGATLILSQLLLAVGLYLLNSSNVIFINLIRFGVIGFVMVVRFVVFKFWVFI